MSSGSLKYVINKICWQIVDWSTLLGWTCPTHLHERCLFTYIFLANGQSTDLLVVSWLIFYMALRTMEPEDWEQYFIEAGISSHSAKIHAVTFTNKKLSIGTIQMLDRAMLKELGDHINGRVSVKHVDWSTLQGWTCPTHLHERCLFTYIFLANGQSTDLLIVSW